MLTLRFLPLARTVQDCGDACIAGVAEGTNTWLRPMPIPYEWILGPEEHLPYGYWSEIVVESHYERSRPEDCRLLKKPVRRESISGDEMRVRLASLAEPSARAVFAGSKSAGLIEATIETLYMRRHTAGRAHVRLGFRDRTQERFDWIAPAYELQSVLRGPVGDENERSGAEDWVAAHAHHRIYLALGLTLPNPSLPGEFSGCLPLVVGVHHA